MLWIRVLIRGGWMRIFIFVEGITKEMLYIVAIFTWKITLLSKHKEISLFPKHLDNMYVGILQYVYTCKTSKQSTTHMEFLSRPCVHKNPEQIQRDSQCNYLGDCVCSDQHKALKCTSIHIQGPRGTIILKELRLRESIEWGYVDNLCRRNEHNIVEFEGLCTSSFGRIYV